MLKCCWVSIKTKRETFFKFLALLQYLRFKNKFDPFKELSCTILLTPSNGAFLWSHRGLISLTFDTKIHDVVTTNSAIINYNVPGPKGDSVPLFDFEPFLFFAGARKLHVCILIDFHFVECLIFQINFFPTVSNSAASTKVPVICGEICRMCIFLQLHIVIDF